MPLYDNKLAAPSNDLECSPLVTGVSRTSLTSSVSSGVTPIVVGAGDATVMSAGGTTLKGNAMSGTTAPGAGTTSPMTTTGNVPVVTIATIAGTGVLPASVHGVDLVATGTSVSIRGHRGMSRMLTVVNPNTAFAVTSDTKDCTGAAKK